MTELMFNGVFNDLSVPQTVALLSCFVCDEKSNEMPAKTAELAGPLRKMQVYNIQFDQENKYFKKTNTFYTLNSVLAFLNIKTKYNF